MKIGIIGGGAAGFFAAIAVKENFPEAAVIIFEKAKKTLGKVKISGGGRCNFTNACDSINELCEAYPRGGKRLKKLFHQFSNKDAMKWFDDRSVPYVIQEDGCVFPTSQSSQSIIDCFEEEVRRHKIVVRVESEVKAILQNNNQLEIFFAKEKQRSLLFDKVIVTTGGSPKREGLKWIEAINHQIEAPIPSLFTFNMPHEPITNLMGIVVENVILNIQGTKFKSNGPLLITHWGMSGPSVIKLSSYAARGLSEMNYKFNVHVNWANEQNQDNVYNYLETISKEHQNKNLNSFKPYALPTRLWDFLLEKVEVPLQKKWGEIGKKGLNKLANILSNDIYKVAGKSVFRDEYVTCGGVSLESIDLNTMQSKVCKNLYFAGEVLDIDAITGGFNLQAAWTTAFVAGKLKNS